MSQKAPRDLLGASFEKPVRTFALPITGEPAFRVKSPVAALVTVLSRSVALRLKEDAPAGEYPQTPPYALWSHCAAPPTNATWGPPSLLLNTRLFITET